MKILKIYLYIILLVFLFTSTSKQIFARSPCYDDDNECDYGYCCNRDCFGGECTSCGTCSTHPGPEPTGAQPTSPWSPPPTTVPGQPAATTAPLPPGVTATIAPQPTSPCPPLDCSGETCGAVPGSCSGSSVEGCAPGANRCNNGGCQKCTTPGYKCTDGCGWCVPDGFGCSSGTTDGGAASLDGWLINSSAPYTSESGYQVYLGLASNIGDCCGNASTGGSGITIYNTSNGHSLLGCSNLGGASTGTGFKDCYSGINDGQAAQSTDGSWIFGMGPSGWGSDPNNLSFCIQARINKRSCTMGCDSNHPEDGCSTWSCGDTITTNSLCLSRPTPTPTPAPQPACGRITNSQSEGIAGVQVQVYNDTWGQQTKYATTDAEGFWGIGSYLRKGDYYQVKVVGNQSSPQTAPAGYTPPAKTSSNGWDWNYCVNPNVGTNPWANTPNGSSSYECQKRDIGVDCSGPDGSGNWCRCNFVYTAPTPTPTPINCESFTDTYINSCTPQSKYTSSPPHLDCFTKNSTATLKINPLAGAVSYRYNSNVPLSTACRDNTSWSNTIPIASSTQTINLGTVSSAKKACVSYNNISGGSNYGEACGGIINYDNVAPPPVVQCSYTGPGTNSNTCNFNCSWNSASDSSPANEPFTYNENFNNGAWIRPETNVYDTSTSTDVLGVPNNTTLSVAVTTKDRTGNISQPGTTSVLCNNDSPTCSRPSVTPPPSIPVKVGTTIKTQHHVTGNNLSYCMINYNYAVAISGNSADCAIDLPLTTDNGGNWKQWTNRVGDENGNETECQSFYTCADSSPPTISNPPSFSCKYVPSTRKYKVKARYNAVSDNGCAGLDTTSPTWGTYWAQISNNSGFTNALNADNTWKQDLETDWVTDLDSGTTVYTRYRARDKVTITSENQSSWSNNTTFTVNADNCIPEPATVPTGTCQTYNSSAGYTPIEWTWSSGTGLQVKKTSSNFGDGIGWLWNEDTTSPKIINNVAPGTPVYARSTYDYATYSTAGSVTCPTPLPSSSSSSSSSSSTPLPIPTGSCGTYNCGTTPVTWTWTGATGLRVKDTTDFSGAGGNWWYNTWATSPLQVHHNDNNLGPTPGIPPGRIVYARTTNDFSNYSQSGSVICPTPVSPSLCISSSSSSSSSSSNSSSSSSSSNASSSSSSSSNSSTSSSSSSAAPYIPIPTPEYCEY